MSSLARKNMKTSGFEAGWLWLIRCPAFAIQRKRKLSISRHSAVTPNPPAPRGRAATFRLRRWHKHAALQRWARRRSGVKTQMLLCADRQRKRGSGGWLARPRSFVCSPVYTIGQISAACKPTNVFQSKDLRLQTTVVWAGAAAAAS